MAGDTAQHAFLWRDAKLHDLGTLGGANSQAWAVNDDGIVVGKSDFSASSTDHRAFRWSHGMLQDLGAPAGQPCSTAYSINSSGQIVGDSGICGVGGQGWIWRDGGPIVALQTLVSADTEFIIAGAVSINDRGEIVATGILPNGDQHVIVLVPCDRDDGWSHFSATTPWRYTLGVSSSSVPRTARRVR
jgi:probable HAF family extracellular repeat protein